MERISVLNVVGVAVLAFCLIKWLLSFTKRPSQPLPPGPQGLPLLGNLFDLPPAGTREWEFWAKHKTLYGPISSLTLMGRTIVIISDKQYAVDILNNMSTKTSARPRPTFAFEFAGWRNSIVLLHDKALIRNYRKAMNNVVGSRNAVTKFHPAQEIEASRFLLRVLQNPEDFFAHLRRQAGAFILKVTYDYSIAPEGKDPLIELAEQGLDKFLYSTAPGNWLVDSFPSLRHIPEWFPGGGFKKKAREIRAFVYELIEKPLAFTLDRRRQNKLGPCYAADLLDANEDYGLTAWTSFGMYLAGTDTTVASLKAFILALMLFPEVQKKGQEEIDRVIGHDRLPKVADRDQLPYVQAMLKETLRWHTTTGMALPHEAEEDIIYQGVLIPKGATLMPNVWLFNNDPHIHRDPRTFRPERFLSDRSKSTTSDPEANPSDIIFGFGRRVCPGRHVADSALFVTMAQILAAFDVTKPVADDGRIIEPVLDPEPGLVSHMRPYKAAFTPRSARCEELIRAVEKDHPWDSGDGEILQNLKWSPTPSIYE